MAMSSGQLTSVRLGSRRNRRMSIGTVHVDIEGQLTSQAIEINCAINTYIGLLDPILFVR